jgi:NitT/TauT family transport system ATP-binding protein
MMWLDIEAREFLTLLGPSGYGKSTLLNILAGFERPDSGKVLLNGVPIERPGPNRGVVFQDYALFPWLSIQQNVQYGLREKGMTRPRAAPLRNVSSPWWASAGSSAAFRTNYRAACASVSR